jgi:hypothetical protein
VESGDAISGQTVTSFGYPVINESGIVAFFATYPGGEGIFTQTSLIAKAGDAICGRKLIGLGSPPYTGSPGFPRIVFRWLASHHTSAANCCPLMFFLALCGRLSISSTGIRSHINVMNVLGPRSREHLCGPDNETKTNKEKVRP